MNESDITSTVIEVNVKGGKRYVWAYMAQACNFYHPGIQGSVVVMVPNGGNITLSEFQQWVLIREGFIE